MPSQFRAAVRYAEVAAANRAAFHLVNMAIACELNTEPGAIPRTTLDCLREAAVILEHGLPEPTRDKWPKIHEAEWYARAQKHMGTKTRRPRKHRIKQTDLDQILPVIAILADGGSRADAGAILFVSENTIKSRLARAFQITDTRTQAELVHHAWIRGWLPIAETAIMPVEPSAHAAKA